MTGYLTDGVEAYPTHHVRLWDLMEQGQYELAQVEWNRFAGPFRKLFLKVVAKSGSDAKVAKGFIACVTRAIADRNLNVLVVSTFSKDYVPVREEALAEAVAALRELGFAVSSQGPLDRLA